MKNTFVLLFFGAILFSACNGESDPGVDPNKNSPENGEPPSTVDKVENVTGFQDIEVLFAEEKFGSKEEAALLEEIKICSSDPEMTTNSEIEPCDPKNYKLLKLQKDVSMKNGFILIIKAETGGFPLRRTLIFQRERGELVKTNGYVGNLIGRVPSASGYDDILMRFRDRDEADFPMFYNCLFEWQDGKYEFKQVEVIEGPNWGGPVKNEFKKETSKEVYESIMNNEMIF